MPTESMNKTKKNRIFFHVPPKYFFQKIEKPSEGIKRLLKITATIFEIGISISAGKKIIALTGLG